MDMFGKSRLAFHPYHTSATWRTEGVLDRLGEATALRIRRSPRRGAMPANSHVHSLIRTFILSRMHACMHACTQHTHITRTQHTDTDTDTSTDQQTDTKQDLHARVLFTPSSVFWCCWSLKRLCMSACEIPRAIRVPCWRVGSIPEATLSTSFSGMVLLPRLSPRPHM